MSTYQMATTSPKLRLIYCPTNEMAVLQIGHKHGSGTSHTLEPSVALVMRRGKLRLRIKLMTGLLEFYPESQVCRVRYDE